MWTKLSLSEVFSERQIWPLVLNIVVSDDNGLPVLLLHVQTTEYLDCIAKEGQTCLPAHPFSEFHQTSPVCLVVPAPTQAYFPSTTASGGTTADRGRRNQNTWSALKTIQWASIPPLTKSTSLIKLVIVALSLTGRVFETSASWWIMQCAPDTSGVLCLTCII